MKRIILPILSLLFTTFSHSQELYQVQFSGGSSLSSLSFITDQQVIIRISDEGRILEWGTEWEQRRYNYYPGKLQPYLGRVDYYGPEYDSTLRGKIKSIGTCFLSYFGPYETKTNIGKLKSVGRVIMDYYDNYENPAFQGKLRFAGSVLFTYYSSFENEALKGKLKSVSNNQIIYYSTFDDKIIQGKIKSIGPYNYTWYISNDQFRGALKTGSLMQNISGVNYIIM